VDVTTGNSAPVADAGPAQTVLVGDTVTLDGSASSDVDGDPLSFSWSLTTVPVGSAAVVDATDPVHPTFVADLPGTYVAQLIVNDGLTDSVPDTVTITVNQIVSEPTISIHDVSVTEGDSGTVDAVFSVTLSEASPLEVTAAFTTSDGTALVGSDYQAASGTVVFLPMTTTQTVTVNVLSDLNAEHDETFLVDLSNPVNATLADAQGQGMILNDDPWTWYVATTGSDAADCISLVTPCLTIGEAVFRAASGDSIQVASGLYSETLTLSKSLTVIGNGVNPVIDGSGAGVVVTVLAGATVTMSNFEIRNGTTGGVENAGNLTLIECWIYSNGDGSTATFGGVSTSGVGTIERCTVSGNFGDTSGGIANTGQLTVVNSTVQGNAAAFAQGIHNLVGATLDLSYSTVAENGAYGIRGDGTVNAEGSIIALHGTRNCESAVTTLGHNLEDGYTCGLSAPAGDLIGVNPMLGVLAAAGGPTPTMALLAASPAIDAGGSAGYPAIDQRGVGRPIDGDEDGTPTCDIGAFEFQAVPIFTDDFESGDTSAWSVTVQ